MMITKKNRRQGQIKLRQPKYEKNSVCGAWQFSAIYIQLIFGICY